MQSWIQLVLERIGWIMPCQLIFPPTNSELWWQDWESRSNFSLWGFQNQLLRGLFALCKSGRGYPVHWQDIGDFSLSVLRYHDHKQLKEERVCLDVQFQKESPYRCEADQSGKLWEHIFRVAVPSEWPLRLEKDCFSAWDCGGISPSNHHGGLLFSH